MFQDTGLKDAVREAEQRARPRLGAADRVLTVIGSELGGILLIALALAILCAPVGIGLALTCGVWLGVVALTGSTVLAWIAAIAIFAFLCRYVWGMRLQSAARRAAATMLAGRAA